MKHSVRVAITAAAVGLAVVGGSTTATATPPSGVSARLLWSADIAGVDNILMEFTLAPGGSTGWHYQDGAAYVAVVSGNLSHYGPDCVRDAIHPAGDVSSEPPGAGNVHDGRNEGTEPVVMDVLYVQPDGTPTGVNTPAPSCAGD